MKKFTLGVAVLGTLLAAPRAARAQVSLNFDNVASTCLFNTSTALTSQYASSGVTFNGAGAVLDQCVKFGQLQLADHTQTGSIHNVLAVAPGQSLLKGGTSFSPLIASFSSPQSSFSVFAADASSLTVDYSLGGLVVNHQTYVDNASVWTQLGFTGSFDQVAIYSGESPVILDDLTTTAPTIVNPEPASLVLMAAGIMGVGLLRRRRRSA